jgi:hypothetical protein
MSTAPEGRHVVRLEFTQTLPAPDATAQLIRSALRPFPGCDLAATESAVTVGVPVASGGEWSLSELADSVDQAIAALDLPDHDVSTFSWLRPTGAPRRAVPTARGGAWPGDNWTAEAPSGPGRWIGPFVGPTRARPLAVAAAG